MYIDCTVYFLFFIFYFSFHIYMYIRSIFVTHSFDWDVFPFYESDMRIADVCKIGYSISVGLFMFIQQKHKIPLNFILINLHRSPLHRVVTYYYVCSILFFGLNFYYSIDSLLLYYVICYINYIFVSQPDWFFSLIGRFYDYYTEFSVFVRGLYTDCKL